MLFEEINGVRVELCEDCKNPLKPTPEAERGFVSPESDKFVLSSVVGLPGVEAIAKVVCRGCYIEAFKRVYPGEKVPYLAPEIEVHP